MREILFRGKDFSGVINHSWCFGNLDTTEDDRAIIIYFDRFGNKCKIFVNPDTVGQYTGLNDKCGNKIFEGDIVKHHNDFDETEYTSVVKFGEYEQDGSDGEYAPTECIGFYVEVKSYFVLCYSGDWEPCPYLLQRNLLEVAKSCEVIGNIYDNPELLKEIDKEERAENE